MIIVAFSNHTSKLVPRIVCRKFRHVAIIVPGSVSGDLVLYQFVRMGVVRAIRLKPRDLSVLGNNGWQFIYLSGAPCRPDANAPGVTCVAFAKRALNIRRPLVQTPYALYKYLMH